MVATGCVCCRIAERLEPEGELHSLGPRWTCNARLHHARPAVVVQTRAHRECLDDLTPDELADLGPALAAASRAVVASGTVERVYVLHFNEGRPGHVHFHLVPRFVQDQGQIGPELPDELPEGATFDGAAAALAASAAMAQERSEASAAVRGIRNAAQWWGRNVSPYRFVPEGVRFDPGERYVGFWLITWAVVVAIAGLLGPDTWLAAAVAAVASVRAVDMALYEIEMLLKMERSRLRSVPRGLVLRAANLVEIWLGCSAFLLAAPGVPDGRAAVFSGLRVILVQPHLGIPGVAADVAVVLAMALTLLMLTGGIAMLIGKVADTYYE